MSNGGKKQAPYFPPCCPSNYSTPHLKKCYCQEYVSRCGGFYRTSRQPTTATKPPDVIDYTKRMATRRTTTSTATTTTTTMPTTTAAPYTDKPQTSGSLQNSVDPVPLIITVPKYQNESEMTLTMLLTLVRFA